MLNTKNSFEYPYAMKRIRQPYVLATPTKNTTLSKKIDREDVTNYYFDRLIDSKQYRDKPNDAGCKKNVVQSISEKL